MKLILLIAVGSLAAQVSNQSILQPYLDDLIHTQQRLTRLGVALEELRMQLMMAEGMLEIDHARWIEDRMSLVQREINELRDLIEDEETEISMLFWNSLQEK